MSLDVQQQIRNNAADMQAYLSDLGQWEQTIKKRDDSIRGKSRFAL
jgi:hypothetical protein